MKLENTIGELEKKLSHRDNVISEIMNEFLEVKKRMVSLVQNYDSAIYIAYGRNT